MEPWKIAKADSLPTDHREALLAETIYLLAESLRIMAILLQPFMPDKSKQMLDILGVSMEKRSFEYADVGMDSTYGEAKVAVGRTALDSLFPPLEVEE